MAGESANADSEAAGVGSGLAAKVARANLANILKKVQAGKTLNKAERDQVAGIPSAEERRAEREASVGKNEDRARNLGNFWGLGLRSAQNYLRDGMDLESPEVVVKWFTDLSWRSQRMLGDKFRTRIYEERAKLAGEIPGEKPGLIDPDLAEFERNYKPSEADEKDNLAGIKRERAYYLFRMQKARARQDHSSEADAAKQFRNFSDVVHDCELRAQRLGRDLGESFGAKDVDRLGRAVGFWLMRGADDAISQSAKAIQDAAALAPLDRETIRKAIEPIFLAERVVNPFARAAGINSGVALPPRFVAAMREGLAGFIEDGAREFDAAANPVSQPAAENATATA